MAGDMHKEQQSLAGMRVGRLTVLEKTEERRRRYVLWRCRCECGREVLVEGYRLKNHLVMSCGCLRGSDRPRNLTGLRFGRLTVIRKLEEKKGARRLWLCECSCGNQVKVTGDALLSGSTVSCGCARLDALARVRETYGEAQMRLHLIDDTCVERLRRSGLQKNNTSGHTGVQRRGDKWAAVITFQKRNYYLGRFDRFEDAVKAREEAEERLHRNFLEEHLK
ncbi:MAG: hypothetical protein ACSW8A_05000 [Lachnospiraceae bacterium]